jgi:hypothetical protein
LLLAPSFNEVRKQLAMAYEGLARATLATGHGDIDVAKELLGHSRDAWREAFEQSVGDRRQTARREAVDRLLASLTRSDDQPHVPVSRPR